MKLTFVCVLIACLVLTPAGQALAQDLSDLVLPSREELDEALVSGEIDPEQYRALLDLIDQPVDSIRLHLLDQIPNLSFFTAYSDSSLSSLEQDQRDAFVAPNTTASRLDWRYRVARSMAADASTEYESGIVLRPSAAWQIRLNVRRNQSGRERFTHRSVGFSDPEGLLREIEVGDFSRRFGLGAAVGYRGRMIDPPEGYNLQSLESPDNGSANGFYCQLQPGAWSTALLLSDHRNSDYRVSTVAATVDHDLPGSLGQWGLVVNSTELRRRSRETLLQDAKIGLQATHRYRGGRVEAESVVQVADSSGLAAVVIEGSHRRRSASLRYAAWWYDGRYLDLTGGSKSVSLNREFSFDYDSLSFTSRRAGQTGGLLRTILPLGESFRLVSSILTGWINRDTTALQAMTALEYNAPGPWVLRADLLMRRSHRASLTSTSDYTYRKTRIELRRRGECLSMRGHFAYLTRDNYEDVTELFVTGLLKSVRRGEWQVWSDLGWHKPSQGFRNWYGFLLHRRQLSTKLDLTVKISHRYYSGEESTHETTASTELRLLL